jgi:argininosuccinate lyase
MGAGFSAALRTATSAGSTAATSASCSARSCGLISLAMARLYLAVDRIESSMQLMGHVLGALSFDIERMETATKSGGLWATDLAEALVGKGVPFRDAHAAVGSLVAGLEAKEMELQDASLEDLKAHHAAFEAQDLGLADPRRALEARSLWGGTAPDQVRAQVKRIRKTLEELVSGLG